MSNVRESGGPFTGRLAFTIYMIMSFIMTCIVSSLAVASMANPASYLNILIQVSGVMVGFVSVVAVFLIQTSNQRERELAPAYLQILLELGKLRLDINETTNPREDSKKQALIRNIEQWLKTAQENAEGERKLRKRIILVTAPFVVVYWLALVSSMIAGAGNWGFMWFPLALLIFGSFFFLVLIFLLFVDSYPFTEEPGFPMSVS